MSETTYRLHRLLMPLQALFTVLSKVWEEGQFFLLRILLDKMRGAEEVAELSEVTYSPLVMGLTAPFPAVSFSSSARVE
jgi:hypothetical protein